MTLEELERELERAERAAWRAAEAVQGGEAVAKAALEALVYAAATLVRRAIAVEECELVVA